MRACALVNTLGAGLRAVVVAPLALVPGGRWREQWRMLRFWTRLHLRNLTASSSALRHHR
jgi:hypothetical protein